MVNAMAFSFSSGPSSNIDKISFIITVYRNKTLFICLFLHALIGQTSAHRCPPSCQQDFVWTEVLHFPGRHTLPRSLGPVTPELLLIRTLIIIIFSAWNNFQHFFVNMQMLGNQTETALFRFGRLGSMSNKHQQPYQLEVAGATDEECETWQPGTFLRNGFHVWPRFSYTCLLFWDFSTWQLLSLTVYSCQKVGVHVS